MKVSVSHREEMRFEAKTANSSFIIDCPIISPLEYFLSGLITCSASDMIAIPKSQGKIVSNLVVDGEAVRNEDMPRKFNELYLTYQFDSDSDDLVASRWVMASIETYCSTINTVRDSTAIFYTVIHNGQTIKEREKIISAEGNQIDFGAIESCPS